MRYLKCADCREVTPLGSTEYAHFMETDHDGSPVRRVKCTGCRRFRAWWWFPTLQPEEPRRIIERVR